MKVKFVKSPSGSPLYLGYFIGDEADLATETAQKAIAMGIAVLLEAQPPAARAEKAISPAAAASEKR